MPTANNLFYDKLVRHQIGLHRLATQTVKDLSLMLNEDNFLIVEVLNTIDENTSPARLERALRLIERINSRTYSKVEKALVKAMLSTAKYELSYQNKLFSSILKKSLIKELGLEMPSTDKLGGLVDNRVINGAKLTEYISGAASGRYNRMRDAIRKAWSEGGNVSKAAKAAVLGTAPARFRDGVLATSLRSIDQVVRMIQAGMVSAVRDLFYEANDHMISGMLWVSVLDSRTTPLCQSLDGKVFPLDQGPRPPAHYNCRSHVTPVLRSWRSMELSGLDAEARETLSGQLPASMTYTEWLRQQPNSIQDEVLGPTRAKLFRNHELTLDRFVDQTGRRYTLGELARREGLSL